MEAFEMKLRQANSSRIKINIEYTTYFTKLQDDYMIVHETAKCLYLE